ncbi:hypothetical protein KEM55_005039 [Ascosphaera atra]|nr:hypothetical protein KEM55_005039 [Ascosphaera atra]
MGANGKTMPGVKTYQYFKLHLDPENSYHAMQAPPPPPEKRAVDMIADYLRELRKASEVHLQKTLGEVFDRERNNIRYFLTVPAIWDDAAKADMRTAAYLAGYIEEEHDSRLNLVTEPEAAAMFCAKSGLLDLRIGDALLIVDCGGGTVDLIAYQVEDTEPFTVSECTEGSGDVCGSVWLNHNFKKTVDRKLSKWGQPKGSRSRQRVTEKCLEDFDKRIKADFRNNNSVWAVDVGIETDCPEAGITDGNMEFSNEEILQCFEDIVHKIIKLVRNQIEGVQLQNKNLQSILLIGGFGASNYLYEQLKDGVPMRYRNKIVRPIDAVSAIVRGAVTAGITERLITSRVARKHYLMATVQPFREGYHPEEYRTPSLDGQDRCRFTRQVLVKKGQRLRVGERVKIPFFRQVPPGATLIYEDNLYVCDTDRCPEYIKDPNIKELVTLTSDLSSKNLETDFERVETPNGAHYRVDFDIWLTLGGSEFVAELVCQGEVMGQCTARFR